MSKPEPKDFPPESPHDLEWGGYNHEKYSRALKQWEDMHPKEVDPKARTSSGLVKNFEPKYPIAMGKEEVLNANLSIGSGGHKAAHAANAYYFRILKAMDEYAKQEVVKAFEWLINVNENGLGGKDFHKIELQNGEFYWETDKDGDQPIAPEQLYTLYQKSKSLK